MYERREREREKKMIEAKRGEWDLRVQASKQANVSDSAKPYTKCFEVEKKKKCLTGTHGYSIVISSFMSKEINSLKKRSQASIMKNFYFVYITVSSQSLWQLEAPK